MCVRSTFVIALLSLFMVSCGRTGGKPASESNSSVTIQADTFENDLDEGQRDMISDFLSALKGGDKRAIAGYFKYPFKLVPPLPAINDAEEMVEKYDLVLDDSIIESILSGRWGYFGWRGFSCGNGSILWADYDDSLRVYQICEKTSEQIKARDKAIEEQKQALHSSVRQFDVPEILAYAEEGTIRVDSVGDEYRLAFWGKGKATSQQPDFIVTGGSREFASTTWVYEFRDNDTEYEVFFESTDTDYYNLVINNPAGQTKVIQATRWDY